MLVTENGRPLQGLTPDDFEVLDNGVRQHVDLASFEQIPLNVVLALDMSASLQGLRLGHLQTAGKRVLEGLKAGVYDLREEFTSKTWASGATPRGPAMSPATIVPWCTLRVTPQITALSTRPPSSSRSTSSGAPSSVGARPSGGCPRGHG